MGLGMETVFADCFYLGCFSSHVVADSLGMLLRLHISAVWVGVGVGVGCGWVCDSGFTAFIRFSIMVTMGLARARGAWVLECSLIRLRSGLASDQPALLER